MLLLTQRWEFAEKTVAEARSEAERVRSASLPAFTDRLADAAAFADARPAVGHDLVSRSIATFDSLGARGHAACARLWLARFICDEDPSQAAFLLHKATRTFDELGSVREVNDARELTARCASSRAS